MSKPKSGKSAAGLREVICPECGTINPPETSKCGCGFVFKFNQGGAQRDMGCQWRRGADRCPCVGTVTADTGKGKRWYCRWHFRSLGDGRMGNMLLDRFLQYGPPEPKFRGKPPILVIEELRRQLKNPTAVMERFHELSRQEDARLERGERLPERPAKIAVGGDA